jgi:hypothetical protein
MALSATRTSSNPESQVHYVKRKLPILCIKDTMLSNMDTLSCNMSMYSCVANLSLHQSVSMFFCLWAGIAGIVALTLNDMSQCAESYQALRLTGIGLTAFSICYFSNCFFWKRFGFRLLLFCSAIFVFVLDCILINDMARGNQTDDCSGGRGTLRLFIILWTIPIEMTSCFVCLKIPDIDHNPDAFYGNSRSTSAELQTLLL